MKIAGIVLAVLLILLVLCLGLGYFFFHFVLNPRARITVFGLFEKGLVKGAEDHSDQQVSQEAMEWKTHRAKALEWLAQEKQEVTMTNREGLQMSGYFLPLENSRKYVIAYHGYGSKPEDIGGTLRRFHDLGYQVLAPISRGYGQSGGDFYGMGWLERLDLLDWITFLIRQDPAARILLFGESMGAATVMMAAGEKLPPQVRGIIEDCGYTSVWDEFSYLLGQLFHLPTFPILYLMDLICQRKAGYGFREASAVRQLQKATVPMLFIHGGADTFVPTAMLDQVYDACASPVKEQLIIPGGAHAQSVTVAPTVYWNKIQEFLGKL